MEIASGILMILHHKALFHITSLKSVCQITFSLGCGHETAGFMSDSRFFHVFSQSGHLG